VIQLGSSLAWLSSTETRYIKTRTMNKIDNSKTFKLKTYVIKANKKEANVPPPFFSPK